MPQEQRSSVGVLFFGGFVAVVFGIVILQERFKGGETCEFERAFNRRHNLQGYACLTGGGLAWIVVAIVWLMAR